jgi:hypothetical protein
MGAVCGALGGDVPEVNIDMEKVAELTETAIKEIPKQVAENEEQFPKEIAKPENKDGFTPDDTTVKLTKESTKEDIRKAAIISAFGGTARDEIKESVWGGIEPEAEGQIPEDTPGMLKKQALKAARIPVDKAVDAALDKALEKMQSGDAAGGDEAAPGDDAGDDAGDDEKDD